MAKINYQHILDDALRTVVREALLSARINGLGKDGCLHITFKTCCPGVNIPDFLKTRYPDTMTIVLQWTFSNLNVATDEFGVALNFDGRPFYIQVPFAAMTEFKDMESEFMLSFMPPGEPVAPPVKESQELPLDPPPRKSDPRILSIDEFRKRKNGIKV